MIDTSLKTSDGQTRPNINFLRPNRLFFTIALLGALITPLQGLSQTSNALSKSMTEAEAMIQDSKRSQKRIDQLVSETDALEQEYVELTRALEQTSTNLLHQQEVKAVQQSALKDLERQLSQVSETENSLIPMLMNLIDWLENQVESGIPFHLEQRLERVDQLKRSTFDPNITVAQLYHTVLDAYQQETDYGYNIESYRQKIKLDNGEIESHLLRIGRTALYYLSLDESHGGYWSTQNRSWQRLDSLHLKSIAQGIKVANKQMAPSLLTLPLEVIGE